MNKTLPGFSLKSFISPAAQVGDWYKNVDYEDSKKIIKEKIVSSAENFVAIGYYLKHIDETGQYKEGGYKNIWECAKEEFGFSQAKASRLINICKKYSVDGDSPYINERFKGFDKSQLQEMLPIKDEHLIDQITPDMSSREIRNVKNAGDTKDGIENKVIQGQMQLTTIEGDYREFEPSREVISEETAEGNEEGMKDGLISERETGIISKEVEKTFQDMAEKKEDTVPNIIINEGDANLKTNNEIVTGTLYDLERIKIPLPCPVDETVYFYDGDSIKEGIIDQITLRKAVKTQFRVYVAKDGSYFFFEVSDFGSFLFYTYEEAEKMHNKIPDKCVEFHY